jgi:hypothetical protein
MNDLLANGPIDSAANALPMLARPIADAKSSLKLSAYTIGPLPGMPPAKIPYMQQAPTKAEKDSNIGRPIKRETFLHPNHMCIHVNKISYRS